MSVPAVRHQPAEVPRRAPAPRGPALVVVAPRASSTSNVGFVLTCVAFLAAMMLGLLVLNVAISGNAFVLNTLNGRAAVLADSQQALQQRLAVESSPASLAGRAQALGMAPAPATVILPALPAAQP